MTQPPTTLPYLFLILGRLLPRVCPFSLAVSNRFCSAPMVVCPRDWGTWRISAGYTDGAGLGCFYIHGALWICWLCGQSRPGAQKLYIRPGGPRPSQLAGRWSSPGRSGMEGLLGRYRLSCRPRPVGWHGSAPNGGNWLGAGRAVQLGGRVGPAVSRGNAIFRK